MEDELIISLIEDVVQSNIEIRDMPYNWTDDIIKEVDPRSVKLTSQLIFKMLKEKNLLNAAATLPAS